jgi:hypothetical protein
MTTTNATRHCATTPCQIYHLPLERDALRSQGWRSATRGKMMLCSRSDLSPASTKAKPSAEAIACLACSSPFPLKPVFVIFTNVVFSSHAVKIHSTVECAQSTIEQRPVIKRSACHVMVQQTPVRLLKHAQGGWGEQGIATCCLRSSDYDFTT